ncbi:hypothetical protein BHYA_0068g00360 [Botrytis hyacinthi]|uniref:DUF7587 domain-containing protein n=1 Tax=Botrytis hyacinthi TaxID=278943 RepID=A0A4Z1GPA2_9HELO|nr:hypothetical protein BHYA_0068g00360 [Botrytis hyacinthi]
MADDHFDGLDVSAATRGSEHHGVLDSPTVINGPAVEETIVADTANDSHASERDGGGLKIAGESDASGDSDEGDPVELDNNGHQDATIDAQSQLKRPKHATSVKKYVLLRRSSQVELSPQEIDNIISSLRKRNGRTLSPREVEKRRQEYYNHKNDVYHPGNAAQSPGSVGSRPEDVHAWAISDHKTLARSNSTNPNPILPWIRIRLYDGSSVSRTRDNAVGMLSGSSLPLNTYSRRKYWIERHVNWGSRKKTPFISCTSNISQLTRWWCLRRFRRRCPSKILDTKVDIINVYATQAAGYPVLRLKDEMAYYDVKPKVKCSDHEEEYLVPYCLPAVAIITTFSWRFIDQWRDYTGCDEEAWYREFVIPLALAHEELRQAKMEAKVASLGFETALVIKVETLSLDELIEYFTAPLKQLQRFLAILKARSQEDLRGNTDNGEESAATSTSQNASNLTK